MPLLSREDFQALYALEREAGSGLSVAELRKELSLTFPEGARVLTRGSEDYPQALDALADPPKVLCALRRRQTRNIARFKAGAEAVLIFRCDVEKF